MSVLSLRADAERFGATLPWSCDVPEGGCLCSANVWVDSVPEGLTLRYTPFGHLVPLGGSVLVGQYIVLRRGDAPASGTIKGTALDPAKLQALWEATLAAAGARRTPSGG